MPRKKGTLQKIADAVGDAVQAVTDGVGLTTGPEAARTDTKPKPKSARKAARKEAIEHAEQAEQVAAETRRAAHRRTSR